MSEPRLRPDPIPPEARQYQGNRAGVVTRTSAGAIDYALVTVATVATYVGYGLLMFLINPLDFKWPSWSFLSLFALGLAYMVVYLTIAWATSGRTYGALLLGVRVVNFRGDRLRWAGAFLRAVFVAVFPIGLFWCMASRANRSNGAKALGKIGDR